MYSIDVVGGLSDGHKVVMTRVNKSVTCELLGEPYIALEFPVQEKDKKTTVTIYMRCGMTPIDAMTIWRERNMTDQAYENYKVLAQRLLAAREEEILGNGQEEFAQMCEKARETILSEPTWPNRLTMAMQLGLRASDVRAGRFSAGLTKASMPAHTSKERTKKPRSPAGSSSNEIPTDEKTARAAVTREGKPRDTPRHSRCGAYSEHGFNEGRGCGLLKGHKGNHGDGPANPMGALPVAGNNPNDPDDQEW
jgi:hypothetical protein